MHEQRLGNVEFVEKYTMLGTQYKKPYPSLRVINAVSTISRRHKSEKNITIIHSKRVPSNGKKTTYAKKASEYSTIAEKRA